MTQTRNAFARWLDESDRTQAYVWKELGISPSKCSGWYRGRLRPGIAHAVAIERMSQGRVPVSSWLKPEELRRAERAGIDYDTETMGAY